MITKTLVRYQIFYITLHFTCTVSIIISIVVVVELDGTEAVREARVKQEE